MKKIMILAMLLSGSIVFAQNKDDKVVTSQTKKTTVVKNGKVVNKKTKVITEKSQDVRFDKDDKNKLNQDRVPAPVAVTKIYMIDNDSDDAYDKVTKVKYYQMNNNTYGFTVDDNGMAMSRMNNGKDMRIGTAYKSQYNNYYVIRSKDMNGVGYYTEDGNFVMEYYDDEAQEMKVVEFQDMKF